MPGAGVRPPGQRCCPVRSTRAVRKRQPRAAVGGSSRRIAPRNSGKTRRARTGSSRGKAGGRPRAPASRRGIPHAREGRTVRTHRDAGTRRDPSPTCRSHDAARCAWRATRRTPRPGPETPLPRVLIPPRTLQGTRRMCARPRAPSRAIRATHAPRRGASRARRATAHARIRRDDPGPGKTRPPGRPRGRTSRAESGVRLRHARSGAGRVRMRRSARATRRRRSTQPARERPRRIPTCPGRPPGRRILPGADRTRTPTYFRESAGATGWRGAWRRSPTGSRIGAPTRAAGPGLPRKTRIVCARVRSR